MEDIAGIEDGILQKGQAKKRSIEIVTSSNLAALTRKSNESPQSQASLENDEPNPGVKLKHSGRGGKKEMNHPR